MRKWVARLGLIGIASIVLSLPNATGTRAATQTFDGVVPSGAIVDIDGVIYGTTAYGGPNCRARASWQETKGCGVVYRVNETGDYAILHSFGGDDGEKPNSGLAAGSDGMLYGTTDTGGANGHGVIFRLARDGSQFNLLYAFPNGVRHGELTIGRDGTLFGVAPSPHGKGHGATIFSLSPSGSYRTLYTFGSESHVAAPLAQDEEGRLFGILVRAESCGGEVFWLTPSGAYGRLYSNAEAYTSADCKTTRVPSSPLLSVAGSFYATDHSSIFAVSSAGFKVLYTFPPYVSKFPTGPMGRFFDSIVDGSLTAVANGSLAGALMGSPREGCGGVFTFEPANGRVTMQVPAVRTGPCFAPTTSPSSRAADLVMGQGGGLFLSASEGMCPNIHFGPPPGSAPVPNARLPMPAVLCGEVSRVDAGFAPLHVFALPEPPTPEYGKYPVGPYFSVEGARPPNRVLIGVSAGPWSQSPFFVRTGAAAIALHPVEEKSKTVALRFKDEVYQVSQQSSMDPRTAFGDIAATASEIKPGMYIVDFARFTPTVTDADGYGLPVYGLFPEMLYEPPPPAAMPDLQRGQQFVSFTQLIPNVHPAPRADYLQIFTLATVERDGEGYNLTLHGSVADTTVKTESADVNVVPGFVPSVDDPNVRRLNAQYAGRDVYGLGDFSPVCAFTNGNDTNLAVDRTMPLRIERIVRLYGISAGLSIGPFINRMYGTTATFESVDPLLVIFDGPKDGGVLSQAPFAGHDCAGSYVEFSDDWDFERVMTLKSPLLEHPEWPAAMRDAIEKGTVLLGMTKEMVTASVGYPSVYGTAEQMRKLDIWEFTAPTPSSFTVKFANGKVTKYDPPGMLP